MYAIYLIATKNIKLFFQNLALLPMMIGIPLFQIYMMSSLLGTEPIVDNVIEGFARLTILNPETTGEPFIHFFAASSLVQFIFIAAIVLSASLVTERQENTYTRMLASPLKKWKLVVGNLIGNTLVLILIAAFIILASYFLFDVSWGASISKLVIITMITALTATSVSYLLGSFFKDSKTAGGAMSFIIILMTFLSGAFTGEGTLPTLRLFTLNKWAVDGFLAVLRNQSNSIFITNIIVLTLIMISSLVASSIIYERRDLNG